MHHSFLTDTLILLAAAVVIVPLLQKLHVSPVLGYLVAGITVGPGGFGLLAKPDQVEPFAELGVLFLLFSIGLDLPLERLRAMRRLALSLGAPQILACGGAIALAGWLFGLPPAAAILVGVALAMSSTATVFAVLAERGETTARFARAAVAVLVCQDLVVVPLLAGVPLLQETGGAIVDALAFGLLKGAVAVAAILVVGRYAVRPLYGFVARRRNTELFTATSLLVALAAGWLGALAGLSMAMGAFLGGLLLAGSAYRHQIEAEVQPFRGLLLGLFFMSVGMGVDVSSFVSSLPLVCAVAVGFMALKTFLILPLGRMAGLPSAAAMRTAMILAPGGEFAFVLLTAGAGAGLIDGAVARTMTAAVIVSLIATPWLAQLSATLGDALRQRLPQTEPPETAPETIVAGFGRVGQTVCAALRAGGIQHVALDADIDRVTAARDAGLPVYFGDAGKLEVWRIAGAERARLVVMTLDRPEAATRVVAMLHAQFPNLSIVARVRDRTHARELADAGATDVVAETVEASLGLGEIALRRAGIDPARANEMVEALRAGDYAGLDKAIGGETSDPAGKGRNA